MDKARASAFLVQRVSELVVDVEHMLVGAIAKHALRPSLVRDAQLVRRVQLQLVRAKQRMAPMDPELAAAKAMWERMSVDEIIATYAKRQREQEQ